MSAAFFVPARASRANASIVHPRTRTRVKWEFRNSIRTNKVNGTLPLLADCVEKVLSGVETNFLSTAGVLCALRRGGPLRRERIHSAAFPHILRRHRRPKSGINSL